MTFAPVGLLAYVVGRVGPKVATTRRLEGVRNTLEVPCRYRYRVSKSILDQPMPNRLASRSRRLGPDFDGDTGSDAETCGCRVLSPTRGRSVGSRDLWATSLWEPDPYRILRPSGAHGGAVANLRQRFLSLAGPKYTK